MGTRKKKRDRSEKNKWQRSLLGRGERTERKKSRGQKDWWNIANAHLEEKWKRERERRDL